VYFNKDITDIKYIFETLNFLYLIILK